MKVILLEGRTDMFYIRKMYELIKVQDDVVYFPCGGASEIWPVIEAFKWRWHEPIEIEAWVDNDDAGMEAEHMIKSSYNFVKVRFLGEKRTLGSVEDLVGFLAPDVYAKYARIEKQRQAYKNPKWLRSEYRDAKDELYAAIMAIKSTSPENLVKIREIFKHFNINV